MEFKLPERKEESHKGTFGKVLNIAGSKNYTGAAFLSSISALRTGCGYVTLASSPEVISSVSSLTPDIVYLPLSEVLDRLSDYTVVSVGCGMQTDAAAEEMFKALFAELSVHDIPVVIDASGLTLLAGINSVKLPDKLVITPHPAEAARLLGTEIEKIVSNPDIYVKKLSETFHCTSVLKGHRTRVCSVDGEIYINETGNSALAKAGSGDVLCGIITGLLAQGMFPFEAAKTGVYLHGLAGEIASKELTEYSVLASDLLNYIPRAIQYTFQ